VPEDASLVLGGDPVRMWEVAYARRGIDL
jgi:hypothetical protein